MHSISFSLLYGLEIEDASQGGQDVEEELVRADEVDGHDAYAVALVNGHELRGDEVDCQYEQAVHDYLGEEDAEGYASWSEQWLHVHLVDVAGVHQLLACEEADEEQVGQHHFDQAQDEADDVANKGILEDLDDEGVHVVDQGDLVFFALIPRLVCCCYLTTFLTFLIVTVLLFLLFLVFPIVFLTFILAFILTVFV